MMIIEKRHSAHEISIHIWMDQQFKRLIGDELYLLGWTNDYNVLFYLQATL